MTLCNTKTQFGVIAIFFHWVMAILIIGLLCVGLYMTSMDKGPEKMQLYDLHKSIGITVLILAFLRIFWRLSNPQPLLNIPLWEKLSSRTLHWLLYGCMFIMPFSGWLMSAAAGYAVSYFGIWTLPDLIAPNPVYKRFFAQTHEYVAYFLIAALLIHSLGALKHHFIDKDNILKRMLRGY